MQAYHSRTLTFLSTLLPSVTPIISSLSSSRLDGPWLPGLGISYPLSPLSFLFPSRLHCSSALLQPCLTQYPKFPCFLPISSVRLKLSVPFAYVWWFPGNRWNSMACRRITFTWCSPSVHTGTQIYPFIYPFYTDTNSIVLEAHFLNIFQIYHDLLIGMTVSHLIILIIFLSLLNSIYT